MPLYLAKVSMTRTQNTEWEHDSKDAEAARVAAIVFAEKLWPDADNIEVTIEPIINIDTE